MGAWLHGVGHHINQSINQLIQQSNNEKLFQNKTQSINQVDKYRSTNPCQSLLGCLMIVASARSIKIINYIDRSELHPHNDPVTLTHRSINQSVAINRTCHLIDPSDLKSTINQSIKQSIKQPMELITSFVILSVSGLV